MVHLGISTVDRSSLIAKGVSAGNSVNAVDAVALVDDNERVVTSVNYYLNLSSCNPVGSTVSEINRL